MIDTLDKEPSALDYLVFVRDDLRGRVMGAEERLAAAARDHAKALEKAATASERITKMERLLNPLRIVSPVTLESRLEMSVPLAEQLRDYFRVYRVLQAQPEHLEACVLIARDSLQQHRQALEEVELVLAKASPALPAPATAHDDSAIVAEMASGMEEAG